VSNALKWFPDKRGLAAGNTAAGFGAGAALSVVPIRDVIELYGPRRKERAVRGKANALRS
jgi:OFA family oxalate/formate antiporter-like MFS transporter